MPTRTVVAAGTPTSQATPDRTANLLCVGVNLIKISQFVTRLILLFITQNSPNWLRLWATLYFDALLRYHLTPSVARTATAATTKTMTDTLLSAAAVMFAPSHR
ncbi:hypothetical protein [Jonesia quinghaiensis]|uniref:hypothetical protein n=1 Tax=Jonesia quinghaiensis TaxID=262806 RepID=UPI0012F753B8|nr:hypothetical protein [Jonesia quinghaiensis]